MKTSSINSPSPFPLNKQTHLTTTVRSSSNVFASNKKSFPHFHCLVCIWWVKRLIVPTKDETPAAWLLHVPVSFGREWSRPVLDFREQKQWRSKRSFSELNFQRVCTQHTHCVPTVFACNLVDKVVELTAESCPKLEDTCAAKPEPSGRRKGQQGAETLGWFSQASGCEGLAWRTAQHRPKVSRRWLSSIFTSALEQKQIVGREYVTDKSSSGKQCVCVCEEKHWKRPT